MLCHKQHLAPPRVPRTAPHVSGRTGQLLSVQSVRQTHMVQTESCPVSVWGASRNPKPGVCGLSSSDGVAQPLCLAVTCRTVGLAGWPASAWGDRGDVLGPVSKAVASEPP